MPGSEALSGSVLLVDGFDEHRTLTHRLQGGVTMSHDPFERLYARDRINVPQAKERYSQLSDQLLTAGLKTGKSHLIHGSAKAVGQVTAKATGGAAGARSLKSAFRPRADLVLGLALNAMKESNNSVVAATGNVFGTAVTANSVRLLFSANPVGGALIIAYELHGMTNEILKWMEKREEKRLMMEHDLILLQWGDLARKSRNKMKDASEELSYFLANPKTIYSEAAVTARKAYLQPNATQHSKNIYRAMYSASQRGALNFYFERAHSAFGYQELSILMRQFFAEAIRDPENNELLAAPSDYPGKISLNRKRIFEIYHSWFDDFAKKFSQIRRDFEVYALLYALLEPADLNYLSEGS